MIQFHNAIRRSGDDIRRSILIDIRDAERMQGLIHSLSPQYVFHLAAHASVPGSVEDPAHDFETNCAGTLQIGSRNS